MDFVVDSYRHIISILTYTVSQICEKLKKGRHVALLLRWLLSKENMDELLTNEVKMFSKIGLNSNVW